MICEPFFLPKGAIFKQQHVEPIFGWELFPRDPFFRADENVLQAIALSLGYHLHRALSLTASVHVQFILIWPKRTEHGGLIIAEGRR